MKDDITIGEITNIVERASTDFEETNTELKRKYLIWSIEVFKQIALRVNECQGSFGTGYPFYALDSNLKGTLPIISEQIRYNRQLVKDGKPFQKSIWECKSCLQRNYDLMPNLKSICKPCPNMPNELKPRKIINRLPDMDMWIVCKDGQVETTQEELARLLDKNNIHTSDVNPMLSIEDVARIAQMLKSGKMPEIFLPIDTHIIEYSALKNLIESVPKTIEVAKKDEIKPYLPIHPKSYRKQWQYDDEAYNFIYDFLSAFTEFNFEGNLQLSLDKSREEVIMNNTKEELFKFVLQSASAANFRRFQEPKLKEYFEKKMQKWQEKIIENREKNEIER